jgi:DNA repair photolyase
MMPLVPGATTSRGQIRRTVEAIADAGVPFAGASVAHLDEGVRSYFLAFLEREYPALVSGYERLYTGSRARVAYRNEVDVLVADARSRCTRDYEGDRSGTTTHDRLRTVAPR